jgi:hypothetical protein
MRLIVKSVESWPKLARVASVEEGLDSVQVLCGPRVGYANRSEFLCHSRKRWQAGACVFVNMRPGYPTKLNRKTADGGRQREVI